METKRYKLTGRQKLSASAMLAALAAVLCLIAYLTRISKSGAAAHEVWAFFGLTALCVLIIGFYLYFGDIDILRKKKNLTAFCAVIAASYVFLVLIIEYISPYAAPYAFSALILGLCLSRRSGCFATIILGVLTFFTGIFFSPGATGAAGLYVPVIVGCAAGMFGSFAYSRHSLRLKYVLAALYITIITVIANLLLVTAFNYDGFAAEWAFAAGYSVLGSLISITAFLFAVPIMDTVFNFVTDFRLAEIISTNRPLLKRLYEAAPGTFNHSLMLANYADACAAAIGENTFLARAAAYYHDVGKIKNAEYFSENQLDGVNPHDELKPEVSVSIIKKHITNGIALAKEAHLPGEVVKVIAEHHGTLPLSFFYDKAQKYSEKDLADLGYRYEGARPSFKMSAIIMIADACEAALRAVGPDSREAAEEIVNDIVGERIKYGQFNDCGITLKDLEIIKQTILTVYAGISHGRIKYPKARALRKENEN